MGGLHVIHSLILLINMKVTSIISTLTTTHTLLTYPSLETLSLFPSLSDFFFPFLSLAPSLFLFLPYFPSNVIRSYPVLPSYKKAATSLAQFLFPLLINHSNTQVTHLFIQLLLPSLLIKNDQLHSPRTRNSGCPPQAHHTRLCQPQRPLPASNQGPQQ